MIDEIDVFIKFAQAKNLTITYEIDNFIKDIIVFFNKFKKNYQLYNCDYTKKLSYSPEQSANTKTEKSEILNEIRKIKNTDKLNIDKAIVQNLKNKTLKINKEKAKIYLNSIRNTNSKNIINIESSDLNMNSKLKKEIIHNI